jgi:hypothetical protein
MDIKIIPIVSKADLIKFIKCQWLFYKEDPNWVPPLISDRLKLLDTNRNPFFKHSIMQLFLAESEGEIVGRIAAIINDNHIKTHNEKVGFFGFFECINNQEIADRLFDTAGDWLRSRGMEIMLGPENPSVNDEIGLLIDGFDSPPVILMTYNPKYYINLIENAGFIKAKDLYAYFLKMGEWMTDKLERGQKLAREKYNITIREVNFKDKTQFKKDVDTLKEIYNSAWQYNWGAIKMTEEEFDFLAADLKQIAEPSFTFIAEIKGVPVGFALALPDINKLLINNKKGGLLGAAWRLILQKKKINFIRIIVLGVLPEHRNAGVVAVMYYELGERGAKRNIFSGEASWILEDNLMMNRALTVTMHGKIYKTYRLYYKSL